VIESSFLHAFKKVEGPKSWKSYINQFVDPDGLKNKSETARQSLRALFVQRFEMEYLLTSSLESIVPDTEVKDLAARLDSSRQVKHEELSYNDALLTYATYALRSKNDESATYDGFGFRTWWLTKETRVLQLTEKLVKSEHGVPYIMRPEFILNFIALAPKAAATRAAFKNLLPTTAGLQLGQHLSSNVMHSLMQATSEWAQLKPERVSVMIADKIDRLKFDRYKQYLHNVQ
jgi:hypothetical protein